MIQVNYVGSSGYGRACRDALNGNCGFSDVEDAVSVVGYLVFKGYIDHDRVGIVSGSSGGYVALQYSAPFLTFGLGSISLYGISGLEVLSKTTHKFEAYYTDYLLFGAGNNVDEREREAIFYDRSPCYHADKITAPILLLQGSEDKAVPPDLAIDMEKSIKANGGILRLVIFEGEGHGFRKAQNVLKAKGVEEAWWTKTLLQIQKADMGQHNCFNDGGNE
jgi:dipeptidyl aminopeptidase/acylaminoacyl peptidase